MQKFGFCLQDLKNFLQNYLTEFLDTAHKIVLGYVLLELFQMVAPRKYQRTNRQRQFEHSKLNANL